VEFSTPLPHVLKARNIEIPRSGSWHKDLLEISVSHGIISELLADQLYEYLTFRHFFVQAYGFQLEESHLEVLVNKISEIWLKFMREIAAEEGEEGKKVFKNMR
jgi:uncharacterized protein YutE (UPF0331/DUF86 family)